MEATHFWVNGRLNPVAEAKISVLDHGFTVADGVFETLLVTDGQVFARGLHLARLAKSAAGLGIALPSTQQLNQALDEVLAVHAEMDFGRLRITVTSGVGALGSERSNANSTLVVTIAAQDRWSESTSVLLVPWTRNENSSLAGLKTTSYAENAFALEAARASGFSEALYCDTSNRLCEGTGSNVFLVSDDCVITPSQESGLLRGITRDLVINWANEAGIAVVERDVNPMELWKADEVFITSSTRDVLPVTKLAKMNHAKQVSEHREIPIGPNTQKLATGFIKYRSENIDPGTYDDE